MSAILKNLSTGEIEIINSLVAVRMITGIDILNQIPGAVGNGYKIIDMKWPTNLQHEAQLERAYN